MPSPIICAIDESERAYEAVSVARDLARRLELRLMLAHVVDEPEGFPFGEPEAMENERRQRRARGARLLHDFATTLDLAADVELRAESGDAATMLQALAAEESAAMLVVASRGRGRIRSALFGSVSANLSERLPCPMVVVTPGAAAKYRLALEARDAAIVCGLDAETPAERLVPLTAELAAALHARLLIIHSDLPAMSTTRGVPVDAGVSLAGTPSMLHERVGQHEAATRRQLERAEELAGPGVRTETRAELGDLATTMAALADDPAVQLLTVARDTPWQRLAARAGCPVLVAPVGSEATAPP